MGDTGARPSGGRGLCMNRSRESPVMTPGVPSARPVLHGVSRPDWHVTLAWLAPTSTFQLTNRRRRIRSSSRPLDSVRSKRRTACRASTATAPPSKSKRWVAHQGCFCHCPGRDGRACVCGRVVLPARHSAAVPPRARFCACLSGANANAAVRLGRPSGMQNTRGLQQRLACQLARVKRRGAVVLVRTRGCGWAPAAARRRGQRALL